MGCTHSRSEDLYKRSIIHSETFMESITDTPGDFSRTVHTLDFVESKFPNGKSRTEMSYNGPPSHLQNSIDVHPFWSEFGREYLPTDRFHDMSNSDVPRGLLPGTDTAQEMRNLELKESMKDLRTQVKEKMAEVRPIPEEREDNSHRLSQGSDEMDSRKPPSVLPKPANPPPSNSIHARVVSLTKDPVAADTASSKANDSIDNEEKLALDFLDSMISESMDMEDMDEATSPQVTEDCNWSLTTESFMKVEMRRRNMDKPVPGVMQEIAPVSKRDSHYKSNGQPASNGINVLRTSMYLPDANFMSPHSAASKTNQRNPMTSYRVEANSRPNPLEMKAGNRYSTGYVMERTLSNGDSTVSIDTGIFSDGSTTNSASSNDSGSGSGAQGVRNLVKIYNEQTRSSTLEPAWKRQSANLDDLGRAENRTPHSLERSLSQPRNLPLDDRHRVSPDSDILDEIRAELQLSLTK